MVAIPLQSSLSLSKRGRHTAPSYFLTLSHGPSGCGSLRLERPSPCTDVRFWKRQTLLIKSCLCSSARPYGWRTGVEGGRHAQLPTEGSPSRGVRSLLIPGPELPSPPLPASEGNWRKALITGALGSAPSSVSEKGEKREMRESWRRSSFLEKRSHRRGDENWVETEERPRESGRGDGAAQPPA